MRHLPVTLLMLLMLASAAFAQDRSISYDPGGTNLRSLAADATTEVSELYNRAKIKCTATGTNTIACASPSAPATAYVDGMTVSFIAAGSSTGAVTLNLDSLGARSVTNAAGSAIGSGDLVSGTLYTLEYRTTGTQWRVVSSGAAGGGGGAAVGADYLQLSGNGTNTNERVFTPGTGLSGTDAGANSTYTLSISDAELLAIAGLTSASDRLPYFTGSGTAALATFTTAGRNLIDDADASAQRTTLGLAIGSNVQAYDAELQAIAGLTSAANALPYFTGSGTASVTTITGAGRDLLDDADASTMRSTLGLGTISTQASSSVSITGGSITGITDLALADGGTGASLSDPNADRLLWWDDSDGTMEFMTLADIATEASPTTGDFLLMMDAGGVFSKVNWSSLPSGGGVSDGDKGDIVVSSSGAVWSLDMATPVTAFGSGDTFPCFESGVIKACAFSDLPGAGGGISNLVEDSTPQLGGQLDVNTFALGDGTRELLSFVEDGSAVNHIEVENNATGSPAILRATGDDTNVDLRLEAKGSGGLTFEGSTIWRADNDGSGSGLDADTVRATTPSATGLSILGAADAAAVRTASGTVIGTDVQGYDAELAALAGLTSAADTLGYFTGSGTAATTSLTSAGRDLIGGANASAQRTSLGLAIGTNVLAYDPDLQALGALADPNADRFLFWDDSAGVYEYLTPGTGFSISGTTLGVSGVETIWIPAASMTPNTTSGCAAATTETTTNKIMLNVCDYDAATDEAAQFLVGMPKSWNEGTITAQFSWTAASGSGNVVWGMQCLARGDDDALDTAFGTAQTVTDGLTATGDLMISSATSAITVGGSPAENDNVWCRVYRDADNGSDTFSADARLIGVKVLYGINALVDD
jgi:hypothetical protein